MANLLRIFRGPLASALPLGRSTLTRVGLQTSAVEGDHPLKQENGHWSREHTIKRGPLAQPNQHPRLTIFDDLYSKRDVISQWLDAVPRPHDRQPDGTRCEGMRKSRILCSTRISHTGSQSHRKAKALGLEMTPCLLVSGLWRYRYCVEDDRRPHEVS